MDVELLTKEGTAMRRFDDEAGEWVEIGEFDVYKVGALWAVGTDDHRFVTKDEAVTYGRRLRSW